MGQAEGGGGDGSGGGGEGEGGGGEGVGGGCSGEANGGDGGGGGDGDGGGGGGGTAAAPSSASASSSTNGGLPPLPSAGAVLTFVARNALLPAAAHQVVNGVVNEVVHVCPAWALDLIHNIQM